MPQTDESRRNRFTSKRRAGAALACRTVVPAVILVSAAGCAAPMPVRARAYDIRLHLDPTSNRLAGQAVLRLNRVGDPPRSDGPVTVEFALNPALRVAAVDCDAARIARHRIVSKSSECEVAGAIHRLTLETAPEDLTLTVNYTGKLFQDPAAGEKRGEIHNFSMSAHVGTNGIYLNESSGWYPTPVLPDDAPPEDALAEYRLTVDRIEGFELAAGLETVEGVEDDGTHRWASARSLAGVVLTGGKRTRVTTEHDDVRISALVHPGKEAIGRDLLDCARQCYDRYVPLVGPYPYREFSILESFFSSGFAFPGFTQLAPVIINEKKPYWRHGYLDHEFLHNWFGNGVYVDPNDGNWCEALTSYSANIYGYELDGDASGARQQRRNKCHFLSRIKPEKDKPLGTFGRDDGAGRSIGYDKGAMFFHMLSLRIGQEKFWSAIRRLTRDYLGKFASWEDLQTCFEAESGEELEAFFDQWVRTGGTPRIEILSAVYVADEGALEMELSQGEHDFALDVPIRIYESDEVYHDVLVRIGTVEELVRIPAERAPAYVELDPDYHLFRRVPEHQVLPTSSLTRYGKKLLIIKPTGEVWDDYELVASDFEEGNKTENTTTVTASDWSGETPGDTGVLVLGDAARDPRVAALLAEAGCPVSWTEHGFQVGERRYDQPGQAVFVTLRRPDHPKRGITVYYGNDESALSNAGILGYYANSLLVFGPSADGPGGSGAKVLYREDLEPRGRVEVTHR